MTTADKAWMREALRLSQQAVAHGNEPFGALLVKDGELVYSNEIKLTPAMTLPSTRRRPPAEFCRETGITDLRAYTPYSSCEPCFMCSGAMVWVKVAGPVYGASNRDLEILGQEGCDCSSMVFAHSGHCPAVTSGVLREECLQVLKDYFGAAKVCP
ncbi:MAG: nucleoside deaminase [Oscillospiraceae bacterium]